MKRKKTGKKPAAKKGKLPPTLQEPAEALKKGTPAFESAELAVEAPAAEETGAGNPEFESLAEPEKGPGKPAAAPRQPAPAASPAQAKKAGKAADSKPQQGGLLRSFLIHRVYNVYKGVARSVKASYVKRVQQLLDYAGIPTDADIWLGSRMLIAFLFGVFAFLLPWTVLYYLGLVQLETLYDYAKAFVFSSVLGVGLFFLVLFLYYLHLYYVIDDRKKRVERVLPDFLLMVAANMRAGMTPFSAFHTSARPEFGPLEEVIRLVAAKTLGTESLSTAFQEIPRYVNSDILKKTVSFFDKGIKSGGHLSRLLESSAEEIRESQELKHELVVSTKAYSLFLLFVVVIGIPLLFAISSQFLSTFSNLQEQQHASQFQNDAGVAFFSGELGLKPSFVVGASYLLLFVTSFLVSILIGVIGEGKLLYGIKYFLPVCIGSLLVFYLIRSVIANVLGVIGGI